MKKKPKWRPSVKEMNLAIGHLYRDILVQCEKCGNEVLHNDSDDTVAVVSCPICGKRYYVPDSMIPQMEKAIVSLV